jgi:hypothetical protein
MATIKARRDGALHCFHCDTVVTEVDRVCPNCGREFKEPDHDRPEYPGITLTERMKRQAGWRASGRGYWRIVVLLGLLGVVLLVVRPSRKQGPVLAQPAGFRPDFTLLDAREMPVKGMDRLTLVLQAKAGQGEDELKAAFDWALYEALDRFNLKGRKNVRVVWLYAVESAAEPVSRWRAMAIWTDPKLPESARPAGIGGDSRKAGSVEYDFTNPVNAVGQNPAKGV